MHKAVLFFAVLGMALVLSACGDVEVTASDSTRHDSSDKETIDSVKTIYELGECTKKRNGEVFFILKDESYRLCQGEDWLKLDSDPESSSSKKSSSSSSKKSSSSSAKSSSSSKSKSSSSAKSSSSSKPESSSEESSSSELDSLFLPREPIMDLSVEYDCEVYECVTTAFLNQNMLDSGVYGQFLDVRDSQVYRTIAIGSQIWLAQNLNYATDSSDCYNSSCESYGRLYYQSKALDVCPEGWHLPSNEEWNILDTIVSVLKTGKIGNGNALKSVKTWSDEKGDDQFGFSGLASHYFGSVHICGGSHGVYWTSDTYRYRCLLNDNSSLYAYKEDYSKDWGMSVRCLMNDE